MIVEYAYAKINLGLQVVSKRDDGYHNLKSVMASIDLFDTLSFEKLDYIEIECNNYQIEKGDNLVYRTAVFMKKRYNISEGAKIILSKNIPIGAGLAGGSSDAAATIRGLNRLWNLNLNSEEMQGVAIELGSDVPFCLHQQPAIVEGRGEIITALKSLPELICVLCFPTFPSFTENAFHEFIIAPENNRFNKLVEAINSKETCRICKNLFNDFEEKINKQFISLGTINIFKIKKKLVSFGCMGAVMSGSGSTIYGVAKSIEQAEEIVDKMARETPQYTFKIFKTIQ